MLRNKGAHLVIIRLAGDHQCPQCLHKRLPRLRLPASPVYVEPKCVSSWDLFQWPNPVTNVRMLVVIFVDVGSRDFVMKLLKSGPLGGHLGAANWKMVRAPFMEHWMPYYGKPRLVRTDPDGIFRISPFFLEF